MDKEIQRIAWNCLPKEFKEEVKKEYARCVAIDMDDSSNLPAYAVESAISRKALLEIFFGIRNLTSDAEGEEMLTVSRKQVQGIYKSNQKEINRENVSSSDKDCYETVNEVLKTLFGSKCLPEPSKLQASCRQVNVDSSHDNVDSSHGNADNLEPKPAEPNPDGDKLSPEPQPANRTPSSYTQPVTDCHHTDRLRIAAMAMQALLSNADRIKRYEDIALYPLPDNLTRIVARNALRYADALVAETQKGGEK